MDAAPTQSRPDNLAVHERVIALACAAAALVTAILIVYGTRLGPVIVPVVNGRGVHAGDLAAMPFLWGSYRLGATAARGR
jgi:hypothetical protein